MRKVKTGGALGSEYHTSSSKESSHDERNQVSIKVL